jgi:predicted signal transduction protein with EAL and GGDEF domain
VAQGDPPLRAGSGGHHHRDHRVPADGDQRSAQGADRCLREAGCKLAIDDFGTGYSALNYLRTFPVDLVKIDRSFVRHIPFNEQDRLLLDGIINIVHNLGMQVVIEGVETRAAQLPLPEGVRLHPGLSAQPPAALRRSDRVPEPQPSGNEPGESDHGELTPASAIMPASAP